MNKFASIRAIRVKPLHRFGFLRRASIAAARSARLNALPADAPIGLRHGVPVQHHDAVRFIAQVQTKPIIISAQ